MAATVQAQYFGASATLPAGVTAETGIKFNREDTQTGTTGTIPIPTATGTNYSWYKQLALAVTATSTTSMSNRRVALASNPATGLLIHFKGAATYVQASSGNMPAASGSNGAVPATYTQVTTSNQVWDNTSVSTGSTGQNGNFVLLVLGVDNTYAGGAGSAISLPNILLTYDEA